MQPANNTDATQGNDVRDSSKKVANSLINSGGGETTSEHQTSGPMRIVPHSRTLRRGREQVKQMVNDGVSLTKTRRYLKRYVAWWTKTSSFTWSYEEILQQFIQACWDINVTAIATSVLQRPTTLLGMPQVVGRAA